MSDFEGERCWVAIDLASSDDIACVAFWFTRRGQHYVFVRHYLPEETVQAPGNDHYAGWEQGNRIIQTSGATTDYATIEDDLLEASTRFQIQQIGGDPWQSTYLMQRLEARGANVVEVRQTVGNFSEPFKDIIGLHKDRKMHHNGDPVLEWMVSNTVGHYDVKENIYPRKERPENKIDGVVAMIMARNLAMRAKQKRKSVYAERGLRSI